MRRNLRGMGTLRTDIVPIPVWMTVAGKRRDASFGPARLNLMGPGSVPD